MVLFVVCSRYTFLDEISFSLSRFVIYSERTSIISCSENRLAFPKQRNKPRDKIKGEYVPKFFKISVLFIQTFVSCVLFGSTLLTTNSVLEN